MPKAQVYNLTAIKDCGWTALARIRLPSGTLATQAAISSISYSVKDEDGSAIATDVALTVSDVIFDVAQGTAANPDERWSGDSSGFNFAVELPATAFPSATHTRVEFTFTPASGAAFKLLYEGAVLSSFDS